MFLKQQKNKGIVIGLSMILEGLFSIGVMGLLYWLFLSRILEVHVAIDENTNERRAINLANVLISSEKIAYEKDGKIMRGVLDVKKMDNTFVSSRDFISDVYAFSQPRDIGIGYPNSINMVRIIDLESCDSSNNNCEGWIAFLSTQITLKGLFVDKISTCLAEHIKIDEGLIFRWFFEGPLGLWQPKDLENCAKNTIPSSYKSLFSKSQISSEGLPILIRYPTGEVHFGRIWADVGEVI